MAGTDSLEHEFSEVSDDSLTSGDETLRPKDTSTMKERLNLKMKMQEKRQKNDHRRARRTQRQQKIKMARRAANERRAAEEQEALANEPTPEEKIIILEKRVARLERNLNVERKMAAGSRKMVTKLTQKNALLEREGVVLRHLAHQRKADLQLEQQARAREAIFIHRCAFAERELASAQAQAKHYQESFDRVSKEAVRKDREIEVLNVGVESTEQLVRIGEDDARRKDECLLDLEKVVEKLASDLSIARKESTEWEIEHRYVHQELLRVQAALAKAIINNPMATAKDRALLVTRGRLRKEPRVLKVQGKTNTTERKRTNRERPRSQLFSQSKINNSSTLPSAAVEHLSFSNSALFDASQILRLDNDEVDDFTPSTLPVNTNSDDVHNRSKSLSLRPKSALPMHMGMFGQTIDQRSLSPTKVRPVSAASKLPATQIPVKVSQQTDVYGRPVSATSMAPSTSSHYMNPDEEDPGAMSQYSRPTSAATSVKSFASSERSLPSNRTPSPVKDGPLHNEHDEFEDPTVFNLDAPIQPPGLGELSTTSVLGPLPNISGSRSSIRKRPTSATLVKRSSHTVGRMASEAQQSPSIQKRRPVSAQARTPVRQHKHMTTHNSMFAERSGRPLSATSSSYRSDHSISSVDHTLSRPTSATTTTSVHSDFSEDMAPPGDIMTDDMYLHDMIPVAVIENKENNGMVTASVSLSRAASAEGKKGKKKTRKTKRNRSASGGSRYFGRGLGLKKSNEAVPSVFGGGSTRHLISKIVKKLDPLALEEAKKYDGQRKLNRANAFLGRGGGHKK